MENDHEVLTVKEVSDLLRVNPSTVYRLTKEGRIPARCGRRVTQRALLGDFLGVRPGRRPESIPFFDSQLDSQGAGFGWPTRTRADDEVSAFVTFGRGRTAIRLPYKPRVAGSKPAPPTNE
jgi:excisionase family DNA binding protein